MATHQTAKTYEQRASIRLRSEQIARLKKVAAKTKLNQSKLIRIAIDFYLDEIAP
jgi:predicted DNA-binding protein